MDNEYKPDLITLLDDDGNEHNFEILDNIEFDDRIFYALMPKFDNASFSLLSRGEYHIMEVKESDGEEFLEEVTDDSLNRELSEIFEKRYEELYYGLEE
ncbi:MAG: DUF1292 domain-containing protein [Acutalibacteraceae bacterium]